MLYGVDGRLLQSRYKQNNLEVLKRDYLHNKEYESSILENINHACGRIIKNGSIFSYEYHLTDHLGNVRTVFSDSNNDSYISATEVMQRNDYYAFGLEHQGPQFNIPQPVNSNRFKYNGKEEVSQMNLGLLDYGARNLDKALGRWLGVDPLAHKMPGHSPYCYPLNNPIRLIDPDGREPKDANGGDDPPSLFSGLKQKWQAFKNSLFGSDEDDQPTNSEMYNETIELGKRLQPIVDAQTSLIPGSSFLNPNSTPADKGIDLAATFIPGGNLVKTGGKAAGQIVIKSLVKENKVLLKLAKETFEGAASLSKEANGLIQQMFKGNWNPGIGTKEVFKGVFESRSKNGARVYFRHTDKGAEILGYSNKNNQQEVINTLKKTYGQ
jgi:RHS repeat-associated protein